LSLARQASSRLPTRRVSHRSINSSEQSNVHRILSASLVALTTATVLLSACESSSQPQVDFKLTGCPTGQQAVNGNIVLTFTAPVGATTVNNGDIVVTNAATGFEIPGTLSLSADGLTITFRPSDQLPFQTKLRVRVQNLLTADKSTPFPGVTLCEITTVPPPITQLLFVHLPGVTGASVRGGSMYVADSGYVIASTVPVFRRTVGGWEDIFETPYFSSGNDVAFVSRNHGFTAHQQARLVRGAILETTNAGQSFDTVFFLQNNSVNRLFFRRRGTTDQQPFGVVGGGSTGNARFLKYRPQTGAFESVGNFLNTSNVTDIDFPPADTTKGIAVSGGTLFSDGSLIPGRVWQTTNGGGSWSEVAGGVTNSIAVNWAGVAIRTAGDIFVTGGGGYILHGVPSGGGYTFTRILQNAVPNPDSTNFQALQYNDVQFAPDNQQLGWIVGAQLISGTGLPPRFQGLIFQTTDGGATWVRTGVIGADSFGAEFPRLLRIVAFSAKSVWLLGDGGTVLSFQP